MINTQAIEKYIKTLIDQNITKFLLYQYNIKYIKITKI